MKRLCKLHRFGQQVELEVIRNTEADVPTEVHFVNMNLNGGLQFCI